MKFKALFLITILLSSFLAISLDSVSAYAGTVHVSVSDNHWALSSVEVYDQTGGYSKKQKAPGCSNNYDKDFIIPDTCKWHNLIVKFNHNLADQGPPVYVTIASYTGGDAYLSFETYGDDVYAAYKNGLSEHWNDKHENWFWLG